jgi:outer membrane lipopolysaccharide assembly protein LptE/RlpB
VKVLRESRRCSLSPVLFFLALAAATTGCGYTLVGTGKSAIPDNVKTVYVSTFVNDTTTVGLEQRLTDAVIRELSARRRLTPVSDRTKADAELEGRITSYGLSPVRFDNDGRALEYQIAISARLKLVERASEKTLFEEPSFLFRQPYTVPDTSRSYYNQETQAIDAMSLPFARSLVSSILEGF